VRVTQQMALTSTFKHQKGDFAKEGFDLDKVKGDKVYFYSAKVSGCECDGCVDFVFRSLHFHTCEGIGIGIGIGIGYY